MEAFQDRADAGRRLAKALSRYSGRPGALVLALPRGGVPVGFEVAAALDLPLDVFVVRKLGVPGREELAMGAIAPGGVEVLNGEVVDSMRIPDAVIRAVARRERAELERREREYRGSNPAPDLRGRVAILVDDGLATGATMRAAVASLRRLGAARIVVAVPVAAADTCVHLLPQVDELICLMTPPYFGAVGEWYLDFSQTSDSEVRDLLSRAPREHAGHLP